MDDSVQVDDSGEMKVTGTVTANFSILRTLTKELRTEFAQQDRNGYTPLMEAASEGNTETVRALLDAGADKSLGNHRGSTALQLASKDEVREMLHFSRPVEIRVED